LEYYEDASSTSFLSRVAVPTIILTSQDDPVVPFSMFQKSSLSSYIDLVAPPHGGHLGFLSRVRTDPDRHWMDWRICDWILSLEEYVGNDRVSIHQAHEIPSRHLRENYVSNR